MADERMSGLTPTQKDKEWYERTKEENRPLGSRAINAAESLSFGLDGIVQSSATFRTLMQGVGLLGKKIEEGREYAEGVATEEANYGIDSFPAYPGAVRSPVGLVGEASNMLRQGSEYLRQGATEFAKDRAIPAIEKATGKQVDPRTADIYGSAVGAVPGVLTEEALTLGAGTAVRGLRSINRIGPPPSLQVSLAGVGNLDSFVGPRMQQLESPTVMKAVTTTDPEILRGVRGGIETGADLSSPAQTKQFIKRDKVIEQKKLRVSELNEQLTALKELEKDPKNLQIYLNDNPEIKDIYNRKEGDMTRVYESLNNRKTDAQEALSQAQSNVLPFEKEGPNQNFFRKKQALDEKKLEESARAIKGFLEQHHRFPKGISAAYFDKMDDLISKGKATKDDLIAMAEFAANQGRRTGDVRVNLLNMAKDPHNELHTILRKQGAEIPKSAIENMLKKVDNVDELMRQWKEVLAGDVAYNMDTAAVWEPLDNLLKEIQSK
tara:strand:- start:660 stop:2138 length:1479 start_codon:yes stop_codon:yes gene_type:complete